MARVKILSTKRLDPSLVEQASERGVDILEREFISVQLLHSEEKHREVQPWLQRAERSHVVFTSFNAVEAVRQYLHHENSSPAPHWDVFCISGRTREAVAAAFPTAPILATAEYGSALAQQIIDRGDIKEVVFFSGNRRREELPSMLTKAGISVHEITVYETEETPSPVAEDLDGVLFFSPSGVSSFFASNQLKKEAVCFAIGRTTAEAVATHTHNQIIISETTSPEAMLAAVYHYTQTINL
jgi:uroporphyrinogen-III synthase